MGREKISIIADDTTDCSNHEQMSVVVRFFDDDLNRHVEHFIGLRRLTTVDAQSIFDKLEEFLNKLKIDWESIVAVCFDGAATMSGHVAGVQSKFKEKNNRIVYVHCYAHCLNLTLVDACASQNQKMFDFFGIVQCIYAFLEGSAICHAILEKNSKVLI